MVEIILQSIVDEQISVLDFVDRAGVAIIQKEKVEKRTKIYPVAIEIKNGKKSFISLVPDSSCTSLVYFEVLNQNYLQNNTYLASVRLVGWFNTNRFLGYNNGSIEAELMRQIKAPNPIQGISVYDIERTGIMPKVPDSVFGRYNYDEAENQYLMMPYDYFAINYNIKYKVMPNCFEKPTLNLNNLC